MTVIDVPMEEKASLHYGIVSIHRIWHVNINIDGKLFIFEPNQKPMENIERPCSMGF
jgi:hypothetical protein